MTLEARVERLEAEAAIAAAVHGYARCIRRDEPEAAADFFADDGWFEIRDGHPSKPEFTLRSRLEGREGVRAYLAPNKGKPHPVPLIHNLMIEVDGDRASANSVMEAQIHGTSHTVKGEYRDQFRRIAGNWFFESRIYTIFASA